MHQYRTFDLRIKAFDPEEGTFTGYASVFSNRDRQNEIVEKGAFTRTLDHAGGAFPLLWQHRLDEPIGEARVVQDDRGLQVKGRLCLDTQRGHEAHSLMRMGAVKGMSIGYDVVDDAWKAGVRHLKELRLWEISLVTIGANPLAQISEVKAPADLGNTLEENERREALEEERWNLEYALRSTLGNILDSDDLGVDSKLDSIRTAIADYAERHLEWARRYLGTSTVAVDGTEVPAEPVSTKAGRVLSAVNRGLLVQAQEAIAALLAASNVAPDNHATEEEMTTDSVDHSVEQFEALVGELAAIGRNTNPNT